MDTMYRKIATKPPPAGAKIIVRMGPRYSERLVANKKRRTAPVTAGQDGTDRVVNTARTCTAKFRDGAGIVREVAAGCRGEKAARSVLGKLERQRTSSLRLENLVPHEQSGACALTELEAWGRDRIPVAEDLDSLAP